MVDGSRVPGGRRRSGKGRLTVENQNVLGTAQFCSSRRCGTAAEGQDLAGIGSGQDKRGPAETRTGASDEGQGI